MTQSHCRGQFGPRLIAAAVLTACTIVAPAGGVWADPPTNAPDEPPEPPVARNDEYYPISYRSFATDISDDREAHAKNGDRQGTMTWSEWWYSYDRVDYTYLVGIGLLTITPISPSVTNWRSLEDFDIDLAHNAQGCTYQASKPDENGPGIQLSAGLTITADGPELGGGASWGVLAAGVTITDVSKDGQRVSWTADISDGSATASGGVNDLLFFGEWRCPKGMEFRDTHLLGVGSFELDDWGPGDTGYVFGGNGSLDTFPSSGNSAPLDGSSRGYWRFDPDKDRWVHMPDPYMRRASRNPDPQSRATNDQRVAQQLEPIFDLFARQVSRDRSDGRNQRDGRAREQGAAATMPVTQERSPEEVASAGTVRLPGLSSDRDRTRRGIVGTYRLADRSGGVSEVTITESAGRLMLTGMGRPIALQRDGDAYRGKGATLFGKGGHDVQLRQTGAGLELVAQDQEGHSFTSALEPRE